MTEPSDSGVSPQQQPSPEDEIILLGLVSVLLGRWKLVIGLPLGAAFATAVISLIVPSTFTARTAFVPELGSQALVRGGLAGLASQFGISLPTEGGQSPQFYANVLKSQQILNRVLLTRFPDPRSAANPPGSSTLLAVLEVEGDSLADSLHYGRKRLDELVSARVDAQTNIVTLAVDSRYPALAAAVANSFVEYLNEFNTKTRQSQARERRRFVEQQLVAADQDLQQAEEAIKQFYERNRTWQQSPQLTFENERLQRQVQLRQEIALTLRREYETARIGEVNDTPVITVVYAAIPPQERSKPKRKLLVVLAFMVGGFISVITAFSQELVERERARDEGEYRKFISRWSAMKSELWSMLWRWKTH